MMRMFRLTLFRGPGEVSRSGRLGPRIALGLLGIALSCPAPAQTRVLVSTIPDAVPAVRPDGSISTPDRPGFRVELLQSAAAGCNVSVAFQPAPWQRVLEMLKAGTVDAAFSASWTPERDAFAVFPKRNGEPDPTRAMKGYTYSLFVLPESTLAWNGKALTVGADRKVIVERGSAGLAVASKLGLEPVEASGYPSMLRMLLERRGQAIIGIDAHVRKAMGDVPGAAEKVREVEPPLESRHGYLVFSRRFHEGHAALVECLWKGVAAFRNRPDYDKLVRSYNNGEFLE